MTKLLEKIRQILRDRRNRRLLTRVVSGIAAVVVFVTTYALILPAITLEKMFPAELKSISIQKNVTKKG